MKKPQKCQNPEIALYKKFKIITSLNFGHTLDMKTSEQPKSYKNIKQSKLTLMSPVSSKRKN